MGRVSRLSAPALTRDNGPPADFNARGIVEAIRIMFHISGTAFTDTRFEAEGDNSMQGFKARGALKANMDRAPVLIYKGAEIGQSMAIARFVAQKLGFFGSDEVEAAKVDMIVEHVRDIRSKYQDARVGKTGDELEAAKAAFIKETLPVWLEKIDATMGDAGFAVGSKISLADIALQQVILDYFDDKEGAVAACAKAPKCLAAAQKVNEAAKGWMESRPVTKF